MVCQSLKSPASHSQAEATSLLVAPVSTASVRHMRDSLRCVIRKCICIFSHLSNSPWNRPQRHSVTKPDYDHGNQRPCSLSPTTIATAMVTLPVPNHALGTYVDSFG